MEFIYQSSEDFPSEETLFRRSHAAEEAIQLVSSYSGQSKDRIIAAMPRLGLCQGKIQIFRHHHEIENIIIVMALEAKAGERRLAYSVNVSTGKIDDVTERVGSLSRLVEARLSQIDCTILEAFVSDSNRKGAGSRRKPGLDYYDNRLEEDGMYQVRFGKFNDNDDRKK
jgi:hypothetical protein